MGQRACRLCDEMFGQHKLFELQRGKENRCCRLLVVVQTLAPGTALREALGKIPVPLVSNGTQWAGNTVGKTSKYAAAAEI